MFSQDVSARRKLQKTATEVNADVAAQGMVSSASVDRFNDPDRILFQMLWEDLARLKVKLPVINRGLYEGDLEMEAYGYDFLIVPAASQKTLDPEAEFASNAGAIDWAMNYAQMTPLKVTEAVDFALTQKNPDLAKIMLQDPNAEGPQGQPPIYQVMQQIMGMLKQQGEANQQRDKEIEMTQNLAVENSEKIEDEHNDESV